MATARKWVARALDDFTKSYGEEDQEKNRRLWLERCEQVLQDAIDTRDKANALKALDLIGRSMGLFTEKKDIKLDGDVDIKFDFQ